MYVYLTIYFMCIKVSSAQLPNLPNLDRVKAATEELFKTKELFNFIHELSKVFFSEQFLSPASTDYKYELFSYTIDDAKSSPSAAKKIQCTDLAKPDSPIKNGKPFVLIYISDKKSKDGKELIGKAFKKTELTEKHNLIYNAYTDGKSELAPSKETINSLAHLIKCLVQNDVHLIRLKLYGSEFVLNTIEDLKRDVRKFVNVIKKLESNQ